MNLRGKLLALSPIYRGNARKTLFTRDGDGRQRLVSLAGEISGTAQALMDAFMGSSRNGRNQGLLNRLWQRLYDEALPRGLITKVDCKLQKSHYPRDNFFDLRMGLCLDEDRWAAEANANYKMETLYRHSIFDFSMTVDDKQLKRNDNQAKLYYLLQELKEGRFWFGAGKSKGLGHCRLEMNLPFGPPEDLPKINARVNHLQLSVSFDATNPFIVGWNWGKVDADAPVQAPVEGRLLVEAMRTLPGPVQERLALGLSGPLLQVDDWKAKLAEQLPKAIAAWLTERSVGETEVWVLGEAAYNKLGKGKYGLSKKIMAQLEPLVEMPYSSEEVDDIILEALGDKANMRGRVRKAMTCEVERRQSLDQAVWEEVVSRLGLAEDLTEEVAGLLQDEAGLVDRLQEACANALPTLYHQIDRQLRLLQSDRWVDVELASRQEHLRIKAMISDGDITESQWHNRNQAPSGISESAWREFLAAHQRVRFSHMRHPQNLQKSMTNDENFITFLRNYRSRARQEVSQIHHIAFHSGGPSKQMISREYGKPYDKVFMRMLSWAPSAQQQGGWEIYIPGGTIKGAFRRRATQILKTLWGAGEATNNLIEGLFGRQGQRGLILFSDAYLSDPVDPNRAWCSMDGVRINPQTGHPEDGAKFDCLYAYGQQLQFSFQLDLADLGPKDEKALSLMAQLLSDFQRGDIPIGGEKTSGFGWVQAEIQKLIWLTTNANDKLSRLLFGKPDYVPHGLWHKAVFASEQASQVLEGFAPIVTEDVPVSPTLPKTKEGFTSHRSFGGHCGMLFVEAQTLTPTSIHESGEPSYKQEVAADLVHGWDFYSLSPAEAIHKQADGSRTYAIPSKTLKGMLRHLYAIASDSSQTSENLNNLNAVDSLFGWVGRGQNQALMGRLSISMAPFVQPDPTTWPQTNMAWYEVLFAYGQWRFHNGGWRKSSAGPTPKMLINDTWRLFPHTPLSPAARRLEKFQAQKVQATYSRTILPGSKARFSIRFWNLTDEELQRLIWCINLEKGLAHKMGTHRYVGFGSIRLQVLPKSYLIEWGKRYAKQSEDAWQLALSPDQWHQPKVVAHYSELKKVLDAQHL